MTKQLYLRLEMLLLFCGGPLLILAIRRPFILFATLWVGALIAFLTLRHQLPNPHQPRREIRAIFLRFAVFAPLLTVGAWWLWPAYFLELPRNKPGFWLLILLLYPLLSVWPQEMLYRAFLFRRYRLLLNTASARIMTSAAAFGFAHVIFLNWIAIVLTTAGGALFALDYERHRSLRLSCLEHSLYGCLIFTIGMGRFFYTGAAWHHG
ncbi:CPBP family intramembrane glutamic endopeptidase [Asaia sp. BMEF1]|uniref:CPBP family glutamic-type intramembrane protease n=1 Tax=Asaia sp. BMEF1 TaxID=3155932 RepID=UPI003F677416